MTNRFNLSCHDVEVTKALGVPSLLTRRTHIGLLFFHRVVDLVDFPATIGLKVPTYTLRVSLLVDM